jgi:hypothetical protein
VSDQPLVSRAPEYRAPTFTFPELQRMAMAFAKSGLYGIKDENQAFALMMEAQAQNRHPALIMRDYDLVGNRLTKKTIAMVRDFQATGGRIKWIELSDTRACAEYSHPLSPQPVTVDWDMERAKKAGLAGKDGGMYSKYARAMLRSRCNSEGIRTCAPDATENMYTPEEVMEMDEPPVGESVDTAIEHSVGGLKPEQIEALINAMDVATLPDLEVAFANAWRATKNPQLRERFKGCYDSMREEIQRLQEKKA